MAESIEALRARLNMPELRLPGMHEANDDSQVLDALRVEYRWRTETALNLLMEVEVARQKEQYPLRFIVGLDPATAAETQAMVIALTNPPTKEQHMKQPINCDNQLDEHGRPAGGFVTGIGIAIKWQDGPLREQGTDEPAEPNGAFVETVIAAALQRIEHYQEGQFRCRENALAITKLEEALHWLDHRTKDREARKVEGTHNV